MRDPAPEVKQMGIIQDLSQGCIKLPGPRTVPVRSGSDGSRYFWCIEYPGLCLRAANRDGSRSDPELDAALGVRPRAKAPANDRFNGLLSSLQSAFCNLVLSCTSIRYTGRRVPSRGDYRESLQSGTTSCRPHHLR